MRGLLVAIAAAALAGLAQAHAQTPGAANTEVRFASRIPTDEEARETLRLVAENITNGRDSQGRNLRPLTAEEAKTLLDIGRVKEIMDVAQASVAGAACGLDWEELNFLKLMKRERSRGPFTQHEIAAVAMVHGSTMARYDPSAGCTPEQRARVEDFYRRKWQTATAPALTTTGLDVIGTG
jgi:hypothetical protein